MRRGAAQFSRVAEREPARRAAQAGGRSDGAAWWDAALNEAAAKIAEYKRSHGANAIGAVVGAHSTNEEAFALKRLMAAIGSDRIAGLSWSPADAPGDDNLLVRANRNPNTRGLTAIGIGADGVGRLGEAAAAAR